MSDRDVHATVLIPTHDNGEPIRHALASACAQTVADIEKAVAAALDADAKYLSLTDDKGKRYIVPTAALAYVEVGSEESRRVGFVA